MHIFPAIDIYGGKAVRLYKGDYNQMTVYHDDPLAVASHFASAKAEYLHLVDLEGAKVGQPCHLSLVNKICKQTGIKTEIGGGIRDEDTVKRYLDAGVEYVILGTAAVSNRPFLERVAAKYPLHVAVGVDVLDSYVATHGWTKTSKITCDEMFSYLTSLGIRRVICTDISRDGAMHGTNRTLYRSLKEKYPIDIVASGGVSSIDDIKALKEMKLFGAIVGKAYYTGVIDIQTAIKEAKE